MFGWKTKKRPNDSGAVAVVAALLTPVLIGGLSIGVDAAYWRYRVSVLQSAADLVTLSLINDLTNNILNAAVLTLNARNEARKYGCDTGCNVAVQYPYGGNVQAVMVTITDSNAQRFFSQIYEQDQQVLSARAAARIYNTNTKVGSGCILALHPTAASAVDIDVTATSSVTGCEIIANSTATGAIRVNGPVNIGSRMTTPGTIVTSGGATVSNRYAPAPPLPDPYASRYNATGSTNPYRTGQFRIGYGLNGGYLQGECLELISGGSSAPKAVDWSRNLAAVGELGPTVASSRGYSTSIGGDGRRIHNFPLGGGGRFCGPFRPTDAVINFGPGAYYFNSEVRMDNSIINALGSTLTNIAPLTMLPAVGGQPTNGVTLFRGPQAFTFFRNSELNLRAPTTGPLAGVALSSYADSVGSYATTMSGESIVQWSGLIYWPTSDFNARGVNLITLPGPGGTSASGCSQLVVLTMSLARSSAFGNDCNAMGLTAFGTDPNEGWEVTTGGIPLVRGRLVPIL